MDRLRYMPASKPLPANGPRLPPFLSKMRTVPDPPLQNYAEGTLCLSHTVNSSYYYEKGFQEIICNLGGPRAP